jgi:flagella basal body P-ring formation protein FlgA
LIGYGVTSPRAAFADEAQNLESIRQTVRNFVLNTSKPQGFVAETEVVSLDPRLRLSPCAVAIEAFVPIGAKLSGNTTVGVRCTSSKPWTVYVPVRVKLHGQVLVAARPIAKGVALREADIRLETRDLASLSVTPLTERSQALGKLTGLSLGLGDIINANGLQAARLVHRGEKVTILAAEGGFEVRASGVALMDGTEGDRIRVRNSLTNIVIQATVTASGVVRIHL